MARDNIEKESGIRSGISLTIGSFEPGLWFDSDRKIYEGRKEEYVDKHIKCTFGIKLAIIWGKMMRPIPKLYKLGFWKGDIKYNPWMGGEYWFVLRAPIFISPFISVAIGNLGFYIGCKRYGIGPSHASLDRYASWVRKDEIGESIEQPKMYLCPAFSIRKSRLI